RHPRHAGGLQLRARGASRLLGTADGPLHRSAAQGSRRRRETMRRLALLLLLGGCAVGPDYERPTLSSPAGWGSQEGDKTKAEAADLRRWWTVFGDEKLNSLVDRAIRRNLDLRAAEARVREARAQVG